MGVLAVEGSSFLIVLLIGAIHGKTRMVVSTLYNLPVCTVIGISFHCILHVRNTLINKKCQFQ
jgi:hypothetical protein